MCDPRLYIAILSCNYGGGHQRVAEVLEDALHQTSPGCWVEIHDYIETFIGHFCNQLFTFCYFGSVRWTPWLYRCFYQGTSAISYDSPLQRFINSLGKRRLAMYLRTQRPDVVVCTYCLPAGAMSDLKRARRTQVPCVTVVTDHAIHSQWVHPAIDLYLVSSEHVRDGIVAHGLQPDRILATGIPVSPAPAIPPNRPALRRQYGLNPALPTILVRSAPIT
jgi:processive 1,2-diacylglycerol beta-glucosyltransferase